MREIIATGKTVGEATEKGCMEIGLPREQVSVEILEMPVKKFFKTTPAKVKVTEIEEPKKEKVVANRKEPAKEVVVEEKVTIEVEPVRVQEKRTNEKYFAKKQNRVLPNEPEVEIVIEENEQVAKTVEYIRSIFLPLGIDAMQVTAFKQGDATLFRMNETDLSSVFTVTGDSIQALSHLVDRAANRGIDKNAEEYMHVRIDISGYRDKREVELVELANKVGTEVNKTHKSKTLQPMNSYERLIVHTAISQMEGLVSESIGRDSDRRVVIKSTAADATNGGEWRSNNRNNRNRNQNRNRGRDNRSDNRNRNYSDKNKNYAKKGSYSQTPQREEANSSSSPSGPIVPKTREALNDGDNLPLYGKIEL